MLGPENWYETVIKAIHVAEKWQDLVGAIVGGVMGVVGALLVAHDARRREEVAAGMLLTLDLKRYTIFSELWEPLPKPADKVKADAYGRLEPRDAVEHFNRAKEALRTRPHLSPLYESFMARIMGTDVLLASFLGLFQTAVHQMEKNLDQLDWQKRVASGMEEMDALHRIDRILREAVKHAKFSVPILQRVVMSRAALLWRLARGFRLSRPVRRLLGDTAELKALS